MLFRRLSDSEINAEEPLRYEVMTGLRSEQLTELASRVHADHGGEFTSRGRRYALGLFGSVVFADHTAEYVVASDGLRVVVTS